MHIIEIPQFLREQKTRARVRELGDMQVRAREHVEENQENQTIYIHIYILLRNLEFHVFNTRERDFHVFEESQKCNNIHIYTDSCIFPPNGGAQKYQNQHFFASQSVSILLGHPPFT